MVTARLTPREREALQFVRSYIERHGRPPAYSQIAEALGIASKSGAHRLVHSLAKRGAIQFDPRRPRTIEPTDAFLTPAQERCLADISKQTGESRIELIRAAVDALIAERSADEDTAPHNG